MLRRVGGSGDHESADIRVLADSGEDHGSWSDHGGIVDRNMWPYLGTYISTHPRVS